MQTLLNTARIAINQGNWSVVANTLQQLPIEKNNNELAPLNESEWEEVLKLAIQVLIECDFQQRWDIAKLFPKIGKRAIIPLIKILENEEIDIEVRWFVGRILSQFDDPACVIALTKLLQNNEDEDLSLMASQALAHIGSSAITALSELLSASETRLLAVKALSQIRRPETIEPLLSVIEDPSPEIRTFAIEALGSFHDPRICQVLLKALLDPAISVRKEAVIAVGYVVQQYPQIDVVEHLKPLLYDFKLSICQQAAIAIGKIGTNEAAKALFTVLKSSITPQELKLDLARALGWIDTREALDYLKEALQWEDILVCQEIITVLGRKETPQLRQQACQILLQFYQSRQPVMQHQQVKQALAMAFGELAGKEGIEPLQFLSSDSEATVRLHAVAALKKLS